MNPRIKKIFKYAYAWVIGVAWLFVVSVAAANPNRLPFQPGEHLTFDVSWGGLHIGEAVLEVQPEVRINGELAHHFVLTAKTTGFINRVFEVRNRIDGYADLDLSRSLHYTNDLKGKHEKLVTINFDWQKSMVKRVDIGEQKEEREPLTIMPGSFDPLSVFFFTRSQNLMPNTEMERPITDGKKNVIGRMKVVKREIIEVNGKKFDTYLLEPETRHIGGVFEKSKNPRIQVWVTADDRRIPVKARSEVAVGSFVGELVSADGLM